MLPVVSDGPGSPGDWGDEFTQGQIGSLNERSLHQAAKGECFQARSNQLATAQANDAVEKGDAPTTPAFAQLSVLQANIREPTVIASAGRFVPEAEMSGDAIEVLVQAVAGEDRDRVQG